MKFDVVIIGSGPGGYVAAIRASKLGMSAAIVERSELGGVCLNWGCIPTKALLKSAQVYTYIRNAGNYGIGVDCVPAPDMGKMVARSRSVAESMNKGVEFLLKKNNVTVIKGEGSVVAQGIVEVTAADGSKDRVEGAHIILATGSRPKSLPFMPIDGKKIISYREAMTLPQLPKSMVIVGSGAIGCEFADFYSSMGTAVTIVEYLPNLLPIADEEVSKQMERSFRKARVSVMTSTTVKGVDASSGMCKVSVESSKGTSVIEAEVVLSAVGVKSNIENIGLEELGIAVEHDKVVVDDDYRTSVQGVYAIGDIAKGPALAHVASAEAVHCIDAIAGLKPAPVDYGRIPSCVYTTPEVSSVGMTEREAVEAGHKVRIGKFPYTASGKATASGDRDGFVKLVIDDESGKLLGAHLVGGNVTEIIGEPLMVMALGGTAHDLVGAIHPHPTMSEAMMEAAAAAYGEAIHI